MLAVVDVYPALYNISVLAFNYLLDNLLPNLNVLIKVYRNIEVLPKTC